MRLIIENANLVLCVDTLGAQMMSIKSKDGCEYLWQGDPAYWEDRAPVLFPFIGRLQDKKYQVGGKGYSIGIHGFAAASEFSVESHTSDTLVLSLRNSLVTLVQYPYDFTLEITYHLKGNTIEVQNRVINRDESMMHFALGGHPGFRVPLNDGERFEDYCLEFAKPCTPERIGFTDDTILVNGQTERYVLEGGNVLSLRHDLFDEDAIILQNVAREVVLKSRTCPRTVTVSYPDMPYLGIWHWPMKAAPYVCIEPWTSLPGRSGMIEEISCRSDFVHLAPGKTYENIWTITIGQEG